MKKSLVILLGLASSVVLTTTAEAQYRHGNRSNEASFRIELGEFRPDGESSYWDGSAFDFDRQADDFEDSSLGLSYLRPLGPRLGLQISGFFYEGSEDLAYIRFEDQFGDDIVHTTEIELAAVTLGLIYKLAGPNAALVPYVGAGGGIYVWRLAEFGDFINFTFEHFPYSLCAFNYFIKRFIFYQFSQHGSRGYRNCAAFTVNMNIF